MPQSTAGEVPALRDLFFLTDCCKGASELSGRPATLSLVVSVELCLAAVTAAAGVANRIRADLRWLLWQVGVIESRPRLSLPVSVTRRRPQLPHSSCHCRHCILKLCTFKVKQLVVPQ